MGRRIPLSPLESTPTWEGVAIEMEPFTPSLAINPAGICMERTLFLHIFPLCALDKLVDTQSPAFHHI